MQKVKRITIFGRKWIFVCHRLNCNDTEFLSARCTEAVILNCCGKGVVTLFYGLICRVRSQGLNICDEELRVC